MPFTTDAALRASVIAAATLAACAANAESPDGARVYAQACAACHGTDGRGRTQAEVGFEQPLPDFTDCDFASREQDGDWSAIVHRGGRVRGFDRIMPAFSEALSDAEIDAAVEHLRGFCTDARWPRGELNMPRALFTEKAFPEDEAVITTTAVTEGNDSITHEFSWEQRFGALNQIEISVPVTRADLGEPDGWASGAGDLAIGVKHTLSHSLERGAILAVAGELSLPTGDEAKGFGAGTAVLEAQVMYDKLLPRDAFLQVQGIAEVPQDPDVSDELGFRAALGRTWTRDAGFGRAWTPMLEVLGARELHGDADTEWDVVPQFQVSLSTRQHVLASMGFRLPVTQRDSRSTELVFYLLWDWYDGGVLEGWKPPPDH
jgi:mono/diheme cytochrome c family protein